MVNAFCLPRVLGDGRRLLFSDARIMCGKFIETLSHAQVFSFSYFRRTATRSPTMTIKSMNFFLVQQVIPSVFFCRELALLNELPDSNRRYSKNFSRAFGRNEVHQAISILKAVSILVNQSSAHSKKFSHLRLHRFIHLGECEPLLSKSFVPTSRPRAFETFAGKFIQPRQHGVWRVSGC